MYLLKMYNFFFDVLEIFDINILESLFKGNNFKIYLLNNIFCS